MLLMPYYGVKLSKSFVHKNNMLENKNLITLRSEGTDVFLFVIPAICGSDTLVSLKQLEALRSDCKNDFEKLINQQDKDFIQYCKDIEQEFFVTLMDY